MTSVDGNDWMFAVSSPTIIVFMLVHADGLESCSSLQELKLTYSTGLHCLNLVEFGDLDWFSTVVLLPDQSLCCLFASLIGRLKHFTTFSCRC